jgi:hypothetical protein
MSIPAKTILQDLFETRMLEDISIEQLSQLTDKYPYFGAGHFLLAKKLKLSRQDSERAAGKAALHFSNELWLHYNMDDDEAYRSNGEAENTIVAESKAETNSSIEELTGTGEEVTTITNEAEEIIENGKEDTLLNEKLSSMLQEQAAVFEKPVENSTELDIETTPYHRIDYFDSQGIKLEEEKTSDKLASQLKRFTDWLKQMKSINPNPVSLGSDAAGESKVLDIAAHSNEAEEIVTETMAEVLLKQGKLEHAIEIYQKLSFNNPSKSAYFAAKIAEIKG